MRFCVYIDPERCKGCELCVVECPPRLLMMSHAINATGSHFAEMTDDDRCGGCLRCANICPEAAIEIDQLHDDKKKTQRGAHDGQRGGR